MSKRKKPADRKTAPLDAEALTWPPFFERLGVRMDGSRPRPSVRDVERAFGFWRTLPDRMRRKGWPGGASAAERLNRLRSWQQAAEAVIMGAAERLNPPLDASPIHESGDACYDLLLRQPRFADKTTLPGQVAYWPHCLGRRLADLLPEEKEAVRAAERVLTRLFAKLPAAAGRARQAGDERVAEGGEASEAQGRRGKKPLWPGKRAEAEVIDFLSKNQQRYDDLVQRSLEGESDAIEEFSRTFGPSAIAAQLGDDCKKQHVFGTFTYRDRIKPLLQRPPEPPKGWEPPQPGESDFRDAYAKMRRQARGHR